ncbi:MAG: PDZ domain-containing protein, partial [Leptospira sp.]|nr:PDZ domain-containing protein [Leptospira sp.]
KRPEANNSFQYKDFESVVQAVDKFYIDKNINKNRAYKDAAIYTLISLPHSLYFYPEEYYKNRSKYEDEEEMIPAKSTFKISPSDKYLIMDPDYEKLDSMRKEKLKKQESKKLSDEEVKKIIEKDKIRKSVLSAQWEETRFTKKDFDKVMSYVQENLEKYKTPPIPQASQGLDVQVKPDEEEENEDKEYSINDAYLAAANGYLSSLDPHSNVFLKSTWEESMAKINDSSFEGIGAMLSGGGTREVVIENPLEGSPALKAGLRSGDKILAVDKKSIASLSLDKVVKRIKGKKGTEVILTISRKGETGTLDIPIIRDTITIKNLTYRVLKEDPYIGYIKLTGFIKSANEEPVERQIAKAIQNMEKEAKANGKPLKALILDLRNNSGGYLDLAIDIADLFLESKRLIVSTKVPNRSPEEANAKYAPVTNLPMVILQNARSASASEIVASAIQHHGRGLILGERSFGKATVQKLMDLPGNNDFVLKITNSRYYSPSGQTIQVVGVTPDIEVSEELEGNFPFRYREEDMWNHLPEIPDERKKKSAFNLTKIREHVKINGKADKYFKEHSDDQIRPDFMLIRSLDYVNAMLESK